MGISPYKSVAGKYAEFMKSGDFDGVENPAAIGNFVNSIGDKNTVSVKKTRDYLTDYLRDYNSNKWSLDAITIIVFRLKSVSENLSGDVKLRAINANMIEIVTLINAAPTYIWTQYDSKPNAKGDGYITTTYDYITFEGDKTEFRFEGKDW